MISTSSIQRRYLVLLGLRWLPVGFIAPLLVLILTQDLSLTQVGPLLAIYGVTTAVLELPTGGLADAVGRRPILMISSVCSIALLASLLAYDSIVVLAVGMFVGGVARALDSGPLESWFVDRSKALDPELDLRAGLARGGTVDGLALAVGAVVGGILPELFDGRLIVSVWLALGFQALHLLAVFVLMDETRTPTGGVRVAVAAARGTVRSGIRMAAKSSTIRRLMIGVSTIGVALVAIETLWQPRFIALLEDSPVGAFGGRGAGGTTFLGILLAVGFAGGAAGAALAPRLARKVERRLSPAFLGQLASAVALGGLAFATWTPGAAALFVAFYFLTGAVSPVRDELLHESVSATHRSTMLSADSLVFQAGGFLAALSLPLIADRSGIPVAWLIAAAILAVGASLYPGLVRGGKGT